MFNMTKKLNVIAVFEWHEAEFSFENISDISKQNMNVYHICVHPHLKLHRGCQHAYIHPTQERALFLFLNAFKQAANKSNPSHTRSSKKRVI